MIASDDLDVINGALQSDATHLRGWLARLGAIERPWKRRGTRAVARYARAVCRFRLGETSASLADVQHALTEARALGRHEFAVRCLLHLAECQTRLSNLDAAGAAVTEARNLCAAQWLPRDYEVATAFWQAELDSKLGLAREARERVEGELTRMQERSPEALRLRCALLVKEENLAGAVDAIAALRAQTGDGDRYLLEMMGALLYECRSFGAAEMFFRRAAQAFDETAELDHALASKFNAVACMAMRTRGRDRRDALERVLLEIRSAECHWLEWDVLERLCRSLSDEGHTQRAEEELARAAVPSNYPARVALPLLRAELYAKIGDMRRALVMLDHVEALEQDRRSVFWRSDYAITFFTLRCWAVRRAGWDGARHVAALRRTIEDRRYPVLPSLLQRDTMSLAGRPSPYVEIALHDLRAGKSAEALRYLDGLKSQVLLRQRSAFGVRPLTEDEDLRAFDVDLERGCARILDAISRAARGDALREVSRPRPGWSGEDERVFDLAATNDRDLWHVSQPGDSAISFVQARHGQLQTTTSTDDVLFELARRFELLCARVNDEDYVVRRRRRRGSEAEPVGSFSADLIELLAWFASSALCDQVRAMSRLNRSEQLLVVPWSRLLHFPYEGLPVEPSRTLEECYEGGLATTPSLMFFRDTAKERTPDAGLGLLVADDDGLSLAGWEGEMVSRFWSSRAVTNLRSLAECEAASGARLAVLHCFGHGYREMGRVRAGIRLKSGEALTETEILRGCLPDVNGALVFLNNCQSGAVRDAAYEEFFGLVRAFLITGASAVVCCRWPVSDVAAAFVAARFYRRAAAGLDPVAALGEVRVEMRLAASGERRRAGATGEPSTTADRGRPEIPHWSEDLEDIRAVLQGDGCLPEDVSEEIRWLDKPICVYAHFIVLGRNRRDLTCSSTSMRAP